MYMVEVEVQQDFEHTNVVMPSPTLGRSEWTPTME